MYTGNSDPNENGLFWSTDGVNFHQLSSTVAAITSIYCEISEEDAAKLWAMIEGLEIVPRKDM